MKSLVKSYKVLRKFPERTDQEIDDLVAVEEPLEIRIQYFSQVGNWLEKTLMVTMRTPGNDFEMIYGFLFSESIISRKEDIVKMVYCTENEELNVIKVQLEKDLAYDFEKHQRNFYVNSSCGVCGKTSIDEVTCNAEPVKVPYLLVKESDIFSLSHKINSQQLAFRYTGGIHASALFDLDGNLISIREDVGRHNALDKLIGSRVIESEKMTHSILLVSGRLSFELTQKAAKSNIPVIVSIGAPSSLAIDLAKEMNITVCGFVSEKKFNVYSVPERIVGPEIG